MSIDAVIAGSERWHVEQGDCLDVMRAMPDACVDAVVTDPPYGLSFMGKDWDHGVPGEVFWREALRVTKPGAHLLAFGGTRTYHRLAVAIEDAGWDIRDCLMWVYGSGFPKSHNLDGEHEGWGTALKPSHEPVIVARNPLPQDASRATIVESLCRLESQLCLLMSDAWLAEASSMSSLTVERLLAIARWTAVDRTNTRAALCGQMDMSRCEMVIRSCLSTVSSWKNIWEDASVPTSTFITAMASSKTIDLQTLKSCVSALTLPCIIEAASNHGGLWHNAVPAAAIFNAVSVSTSDIRTLFAHASAIGQGLIPHPDAIDQDRLHRPIVMARTPLIGTVAENVQRHGTGALNIDGCRIASNDGFEKQWDKPVSVSASNVVLGNLVGGGRKLVDLSANKPIGGRWPANVIHDGSDEVVAMFPAEAGGGFGTNGDGSGTMRRHMQFGMKATGDVVGFGDTGSAARFFYVAKADRADRDEGVAGVGALRDGGRPSEPRRNHHPTVKPTDLMAYLIRLVTPPGGIVLDPFTGSGSTGKAAMREGNRFIGAELSADYIAIARARIGHAAAQGVLF